MSSKLRFAELNENPNPQKSPHDPQELRKWPRHSRSGPVTHLLYNINVHQFTPRGDQSLENRAGNSVTDRSPIELRDRKHAMRRGCEKSFRRSGQFVRHDTGIDGRQSQSRSQLTRDFATDPRQDMLRGSHDRRSFYHAKVACRSFRQVAIVIREQSHRAGINFLRLEIGQMPMQTTAMLHSAVDHLVG